MNKSRKGRKTQAKRSFWNFKTTAQSMTEAYKVPDADNNDFMQEDENPATLSAVANNSIKDIEELRDNWGDIQDEWKDIGFPIKHNPFE